MKWSEVMQRAIAHAQQHRNLKASAQLFGVPATTMCDKMTGKAKGKVGHPTALSAEQERKIVDACVLFAEWGFGFGRREVESIIQTYLKASKQRNPFRDEYLGWRGGVALCEGTRNSACEKYGWHARLG